MAELGLTSLEQEAVERTWDLVGRNLKHHGVEIFILLFKNHPDYQSLFHQFKGKSLAEVAKSPKLRAHGSTFMHGLAAMMESLDDKDTLVCLLHANVERHFKRNIKAEHYLNTFTLLPGYLSEKLGEDMDEDASSGWMKILQLMKTVMQAKVKEMELKECEN